MRSSNRPQRPWLRDLRRIEGSRLALICFPHAGGGASTYHSWTPFLAEDVSLSAVQYPGHEDRLSESLVASMADLVEGAANEVLPKCDARTVLFGHSMGAVVAYEMALKAKEEGAPLRQLVVSAHGPPHRNQTNRAPLNDAEIMKEVQIASGSASLFDHEAFRDLFLPSLRNDYALIYGYRRIHPAGLDIPIMALGGRSDPRAPPPEMAAWKHLAPTGAFRAVTFEGGHFYLRDRLRDVVRVICGDAMEHA